MSFESSVPVIPEGYELEVSQLKDRLWVNAPDGSCVARFSKRFGADLHHTVTEMMAGAPECIHCTHGVPTSAEWNEFRSRLAESYQVFLPESTLAF